MKILHVESGRHLYGGARQVAYLVEGLAARGIECVVVAPPDSGILEALPGEGVTAAPTKMGGDLDAGLILRLRELIRAEKPDLIHLHSRRGADLFGGVAGRLAGLPTVLSRRVDNPQSRLEVATKYPLFDRVMAISEAIRDVVLSQGVPAEKVVCIRSAVRIPPAVPREEGLATVREILGVGERDSGEPDTGPFIGMMAQLIERKGHDLLLDAFPAVLQRHPSARLLLLGKGPLRERIETRVAEMGLGEAVRLPGFRSDLDRVRAGLDVVVHPATAEGLGVAVLEASGSGLPVVAGAHGGLPEIIEDGETGFLVDPTDPEALAGAISTLLADPDLRARMGAAGRARVTSLFSVERMVEEHVALYRDLLG
jgi:glycosyltransferase involved in cell wall biosynthesis